jgi:hypothetical protein
MDILGGGLVGRLAHEIGKPFDLADIVELSLGAARRIAMSSIGRWRNGLMALSVLFLGGLRPSISRQDVCSPLLQVLPPITGRVV